MTLYAHLAGLKNFNESMYYIDDETGCWMWGGPISKAGYATKRIGTDRSRTMLVHRRLYEEVHGGPLPRGTVLHHRCQRKSCINPDHLFAVSRNEHQQVHLAARKFTNDQIVAILRDLLDGMTLSEVSEKHGVSKSYASKIRYGTRNPQ